MIILFVIVVLLDFMEEPEVKGHVDVGLGSHDQTSILLNRLVNGTSRKSSSSFSGM
jgi:hypothetical protein